MFRSFKLIMVGLILPLSLFTVTDCSSQGLGKAPAVIACRASGDLDIFALSPSDETSGVKETERVVLEVPTSPVKERSHYWEGGAIFFGSEPDGGCWTRFGQKAMHGVSLNEKELTVFAFKQEGERWAFVLTDSTHHDNTLYQDVNGKATPIAMVEYRRAYKTETGDERRADMLKRMGKDEKWCFTSGDKVYVQEPSGVVTQIGWMGWRVVTPPKGAKLVVMMTKGMGKGAKWSGRHAGMLYVETRE